jgi:hypothetical protein
MPAKNYTTTAVAVGTAGNDQNNESFVAEYAGVVTSVTYTPNATITGAATNNRTVNLVNKGQTGVGTTVIATLNFGNGTNATAGDEKAITLSGTAANLVVASGDVLEWQSVHIGTGITDPGGLVKVTIDRTYS